MGGLYVETLARGELIQTGQRAVDLDGLLIEALTRFGRPNVIAADRWREAELRDALDKAGVPPAALEIRGMGWRDGAEDVRGFRRAILEGKVTPKPTKLLRYAMAEARVLMDPAGNAKLAKRAEGGRRSTARDDAAALRSWPLRRALDAPPHRPLAVAVMRLSDEQASPAAIPQRAGGRLRPPGRPGRGKLDVRGVRALRQRSAITSRPLQRGGKAWDRANLQVLCRACHIEKTRRENTASSGRAPWRGGRCATSDWA